MSCCFADSNRKSGAVGIQALTKPPVPPSSAHLMRIGGTRDSFLNLESEPVHL